MKKISKILSVFLAIIMVVCAFPISVSAQNVTLTIESSKNDIKTGDTVTVNVILSENSNLNYFTLDLLYDNAKLEYVSTNLCEINGAELITNPSYSNNKIRIAMATVNPITAGGTVLSVNFKALSSSCSTISVDVIDSGDKDFKNIAITTSPIKIHSFGEWEVIREPSIISDGKKTRLCSLCGYVETETVDKIVVDVNNNQNYGQVNFTVVNAQTIEPIKNANIFISTENDGENTFVTDENGKASIILPVGEQIVSVYADGCLTRNIKITVNSGINDIPHIGLSDKPTYDAQLTSKEMTPEEIEDAGIDTSDPSNKHVYKYELELNYDAEIDLDSIFYYMNTKGEIYAPTPSDSGEGSWIVIPFNNDSGVGFYNPEVDISVYPITEYFYLIIHGKVTWLKEMFDVEMLIINNSMTDTLENLTATLNLPDGLSLAKMIDYEQTLSQQIDKIPEGESKSVHWYVRGDEAGSYNVDVRLQGMIMPFEEPIDDKFICENQINVYAGNAMHLHFEFPDTAYYGEDYPITITLENVCDKTLYYVNHMVQIEQGMEIYYFDGTEKKKIEHSQWKSIGVEEFNPGDKIVIEASVNIFFDSEVIKKQIENFIGIINGIEQLTKAYDAVTAGFKFATSLINGVTACVEALDDFAFSTITTKDILFKELYDEISSLYSSCTSSGNKTFDAAAGVFNSGLNATLTAITNDPEDWFSKSTVESIEQVLADVKGLAKTIDNSSQLSKNFNIFDSLRTLISAIPVRYVLSSVVMTEDENNTTRIPWSYSAYPAGPQYFGVTNVNKHIFNIMEAYMGQELEENVPGIMLSISGVDDAINKDEAIAEIKAVEAEIARVQAKDATGTVTFRAWVERKSNTYALVKNTLSNDFVLECDNKTATYKDGVLTFTGNGMISITPQNQNGGILYIEDSKGNVYTYVIDVVEQHKCKAGSMEVIIAPTSEYDGFAVKCCEICDDILEIIPLAFEDCCETHSFTDWTIENEATEENSGVKTRFCSACGATEYEFIEKTAHTHVFGDWTTVTDPTCETAGERCKSCSCGEKIKETIDALGHDYATEFTVDSEPNCTDQGSKSQHCSRCESRQNVTEIPVTGHDYKTEITKAPTHTENGEKTFTCNDCSDTYTESIAADGTHKYISVVTKDATCSETGVMTYTCACGDSYTEDIPATGHSVNDDGYCETCEEKVCNHNCHQSGILGFFWKIANFFNKLFGSKKYCDCGVAHY